MRVGPSLIPGAVVCGNRGLGVPGSTILAETSTGDHGAGFLYNDVDPGDEGKAFRGLIVTPPSTGTFFAYEDGSFSLVAPDGSYTFVYRLYVDGVDLGTATASVTIGDSPVTATGAIAPLSIVAPTASATGAASASGALASISLTAPTATATASVPGTAIWPTPDQVLSGITYGPTGADYTGTATAGGSPTAEDIAAAVRVNLSAELALIDAAISSRATVSGILGATVP